MNRQRRERGQVLVEFAFVLPLMVVLTLGVVTVGVAVQQAMLVQEAAAEGAAYASFTSYNASQTSLAQTAASNAGLGAKGLNTPVVTQFCTCTPWTSSASVVSCTSTCNVLGFSDNPMMYVQVTVSSQFNSLFPYSTLPRSFSLSSTVVMPVQ